MTDVMPPDESLLTELRGLIEQARQYVAQTANSTVTVLYWHVGMRIRRELLNETRADYGERIVATVSRQLVAEYGKGFAEKSVRRMIQFAEVFPEEQIVATLSQHLSWSHFVEILPLKKLLEREFYAEMCRIERWSVRTLRERIGSQLYLRTALTKQPEALVDAELVKHLVEREVLDADHEVAADLAELGLDALPGRRRHDLEIGKRRRSRRSPVPFSRHDRARLPPK